MKLLYCILVTAIATSGAIAHVSDHPSIHDTAANITKRLGQQLSPEQLCSLNLENVFDHLTEDEIDILGSEYISFRVNVPVRLTILHDRALRDKTPWLKDDGFELTDLSVTFERMVYDVWQKDHAAGSVGLGVNSFGKVNEHYVILVQPSDGETEVRIDDLYPGQLRTSIAERGSLPYVDYGDRIDELPPGLEGALLIQVLRARRSAANILQFYKVTKYPATDTPDQVLLTWSGDPGTTQTVQWRTSEEMESGSLRYVKKSDYNRFNPGLPKEVKAVSRRVETADVANDPVNYRHTVRLHDLEPATTYLYSVGNGTQDGWTEFAEFTTAPDRTQPFSFVYMGDVQNGFARWRSLVHTAFRQRPDAAFYVLAGDLVNRGNDRDDWDDLFHNSSDIFDRRQLVPAVGNHECQGGHPTMYLDLFDLPGNGPENVEKERVYSFEYSNALFVVLDTNIPSDDQTGWLEDRLSSTNATWKFVVFHHPVYASRPGRDYSEIHRDWLPLFDKYHVDMVLQGHDHAYLRTYAMKRGEAVDGASEGTIYIVASSGTKMYQQGEYDYIEYGMTNVATFQVLDLQVSGDRLLYRAYDTDGDLKDEIEIVK